MATASTPVTIVKYLSGQKRKAEDEPTIYQFFSRSKDPDAKILSNFHKIKKKITVTINGEEKEADSAEALFQYAKYKYATSMDPKPTTFDPETILTMEPADAKSNGGKGGMKKNRYELNEVDILRWDANSIAIMKAIVAARFAQDPDFKRVLIGTGEKYLLHFSRGDKKWGGKIPAGMDKIKENITGENILGKILMELRDSHSNPAPSLLDME